MGRKLVSLCLAGCFGLIVGIAGIGTNNVYAEGSKKLAMEGAVFDLKASTSGSLSVYGFVSDKGFHAVSGAQVTLKPTKGAALETESQENGYYEIGGVEDNMAYTIQAKKGGLGSTKKIRFKVPKNEGRDFAICLDFKKQEKPPK